MESIAQTVRHNPPLAARVRAVDLVSDRQRNAPRTRPQPPGLASSLNCNRIALKCLKMRPNSLSDELVMAAADALLRWIDLRLDNPVKIVESGYVRTVTLFECIHYVRDAYDSSFTGYLSYDKPRPATEYAIVSLDPLLTTHRWILPVMQRAIPWAYLMPIMQQHEAYHALAKQAALLIGDDSRFIQLREQRLKEAIDLDTSLLTIISRIFEGGEVSSDDLTIIWRNRTVYQQLIDEHSDLIRFFHAANRDRYLRAKAALKLTGANAGKAAPPDDQAFDLSCVRDLMLASGLTKGAWRYLHRYGDKIFRYVWQVKPRRFTHFQVALRYLKFLAGHGFPPPPAPSIIRALLHMQGYVEGADPDYVVSWESLNSRVITLALHHYGKLGYIREEHIDDLLLVAYDDLDYGFDPDSNQLKRGWSWLVDRSRRRQDARLQQARQENLSWPTSLGDFELDGLRIREIGNLHALCSTASTMRNCLANRDDDCVANQARFFSVEQPGKKRPVAVVGLSRQGKQWAVEDARGFANAAVDESLQQLSRDIAARYERLRNDQVKRARRQILRLRDL